MPFNDIEMQRIKKLVGGFCQERIPDHQRSQIKLFYEIHGFEVKLIESRPVFIGSHLWAENAIAKIHYDPYTLGWQLYCLRASGKWQKYPGSEPTNNLKSLINTVANDPYQLFWG
jgi:hypothetical protein